MGHQALGNTLWRRRERRINNKTIREGDAGILPSWAGRTNVQKDEAERQRRLRKPGLKLEKSDTVKSYFSAW